VSELAEKRRRLHALLASAGLDALVLRRPANVAWYSGGGRTHVLAVQETGVAAVVVRGDGDEVVAPVNEAARLEEEELGALGARLRVVGWDGDLAAELPRGPRVGSDVSGAGTVDVSAALEEARRALTPEELERYRLLGTDAAAALTDALLALDPGRSEHAAAAEAARACVERGIDPIVLLVAGESRLPRHRHPLPSDAALGRLAMIVVCARRHGLIASLTRFVSFGPLAPELLEAQERLLQVDVAFNRATRARARVGDVFAAGAHAYAEQGFAAAEWRLHHQGGPTGYEPRDYLATAASEPLVVRSQAFAWNPSVPSLKCEDTVVATDGQPEVLTVDSRWPTRLVAGLARPLVLER
jgi:Xaa-Pro aminopeptidase